MKLKTNVTKLWAMALATLVVGVVAATACSSDSSSSTPGNSSTTCTLAGNACEFGCTADLGCAQCRTNTDCQAGAPICSLGRCSECGSSADCATGQVCAPATHQCEAPCATNADCAQNLIDRNSPLCDPVGLVCVGCLTATDCPAASPICDPTRKQCSQCASRADCGVAAPACNLQNGQCEECLVDTDCNGSGACGQDHQCHPICTTDADCTGPNNDGIAGDGNFCNVETGACVECLTAANCSTDPTQPVCSTTRYQCVACAANTDCPAATPICQTGGFGQGGGQGGARCVACNNTTPCANPATPICTNEGLCVACENDNDCNDPTLPTCNDLGICVAGG